VKLDDEIQYVKGVGPKRAEMLARSGIATVEDLLYHLPFRYEDRRVIVAVREARPGRDVTLVGRISGAREIPMRRRRGRPMLSATFSDDSGRIELFWFHQAGYFKKKLESGSLWLVHGRVESGKRGGWQIVHPEIEALDDNDEDEAVVASAARIVPVYQKPGEMPVAAMRKIVAGAVEAAAHLARSVVPPDVRKRVRLEPLDRALLAVHFPNNDVDAVQLAAFATPAHRTLIFEELFALQVGMRLRKLARQQQPGVAMPPVPKRLGEFFRSLPFKPTGAQHRVIAEVSADMAARVPMNRLVHGDVGSGSRRSRPGIRLR
jgi:ATP-dependent DNA helicase RecG